MTLTLRMIKKHMGWEEAKDDFVILDDAGNSVGRIHKDPTSPKVDLVREHFAVSRSVSEQRSGSNA
jgi:hypothetical protein